MSAFHNQLDWVPARLQELLNRYSIPGVALGVWLDGEEYTAAAGMANLRAGIEATPDTLFLVGSITKVFTTSLVMQLVEEGKVELDAPVRTYLPELRLSDDDATERVTVRHLLTHTSGIAGDYFPDCGRGDDAVEKCVATLPDVPMLHKPGEMFSYCNIGFIIAGRLIERVTGDTWDNVLRQRLLDPLGLDTFSTLPEEVLLHRVGVGHVPDRQTGALVPGQMWPEVRAGGPAGFTPWATVSDLLAFSRLHVDGGVTPSGERLLSEESVAAMQQQHVQSNPSGAYDGDGWGMGWARHRYSNDEPVIGHNGGAAAVLRVLPERRLAIASLSNAPMGMLVGLRIIDDIVNNLFDLHIPQATDAPVDIGDLSQYEGIYRHLDFVNHVAVENQSLTVTTTARSTSTTTLRPINRTTFTTHSSGSDMPYKAAFLQPDNHGAPAYFHIGGRAFRKE